MITLDEKWRVNLKTGISASYAEKMQACCLVSLMAALTDIVEIVLSARKDAFVIDCCFDIRFETSCRYTGYKM